MAFVVSRQDTTGLLILTDTSTGRIVSRAELPTDLANLAVAKGALPEDQRQAVVSQGQALEQKEKQDRAATNPPPDTAKDSVENQTGNTTEQPLSKNEEERLKANTSNAPQEADPDSTDRTATNPNASFGSGVAEAQAASRTDSSYYSGTTNQGGYAQSATNQSDIQQKKTLEIGTSTVEPPTVGRNLLHQYASYTYNISLHMLSKADFNQMGRDPDSNWVPSKTLIGGAGKYGVPGFNRDKNFLDDFYFDNLKINTVIGSTAGSQGTNAIDLSFTIIEPYGITLLDRLIDACLDPAVDGKNYLEIPYLIQIDFYGYDDEGVAQSLIKQRKYLPISLNSMAIKAGTKGAEYQITATPYVHSGFQESIASTPANFEIVAKTLQEFFLDVADSNDLASANKDNQRLETEKANAEKQEKTDPAKNNNARTPPKTNSTASGTEDSSPTYEVKSFVSAYNAWGQASVTNKNATDYNRIKVVIDEAILKSNNGNGGKIVNPKVQAANQTPTINNKSKKGASKAARSNYGKPDARPDFSVSKFAVAGQTSIMAVINNIMLSSEYIRSQIIDATKDAETNAKDRGVPLQWWKIVPDVKLRSYCPKTSKWYLDITYYVQAYTVYNRTHPNASKSLPVGWHREYNYIYTGQNSDIIDFSIEFDTAFYTAISIDRARVTATQVQASVDTDDPAYLEQKETDTLDDQKRRAIGGLFQPPTLRLVADSLNAAPNASNRQDSTSMAAASVAEYQNSGASADQLVVRLKIVGDPQFIKQDEIYYSPAARRYNEELSAQSNYVTDEASSIAMDKGEVHVKLSWKTPVDIDEETGALRLNNRYHVSAFTGLYQVQIVESVFSQGKFEQTLDLIRLPDQSGDTPDQGKQTNDIRRDALPTAKKDGNPTGYTKQDSASVEEQKTTVMTKLLENRPGNSVNNSDSNYFRPGASPGGYAESAVPGTDGDNTDSSYFRPGAGPGGYAQSATNADNQTSALYGTSNLGGYAQSATNGEATSAYFSQNANQGGYVQGAVNRTPVDTTPERDNTGYGEEYQNAQARALRGVNKTAPTVPADTYFTI